MGRGRGENGRRGGGIRAGQLAGMHGLFSPCTAYGPLVPSLLPQRQYLDVIESIAFRVDHAGLFRVCMDTPTGLNTKLEGVSESECQNQPTAVQCVMKSDVSALEPLFSQTYPDVEALCLTTTDSEDVWRNVLGEDYRDSINAARAFAIIAGFFGALVLAYLIHYHDVRESRCTVPKVREIRGDMRLVVV